ncbi:biliverdin-producing heme oxygenase [Flavobacterium zepuense]|uniref:Biliverdin-producing heme oxygenase n=1 Tax=Flavobacterium zepuense TaxID=2593302 RepID=A0A552V5U6_9FLAO|nr:biliverdin-producing heme oxygenase [Flavobacterium zepuense]TRW25828.1 biliverdin-producing heme oxygenase [Flavobacterium zepuense]
MNNTVSAPAFLEKLRLATTQSHTNLEALPVSVSIMNPAVTNTEYALYLNLMHDVVKDAEENIFPLVHNTLPELDVHPKAQFITADLATLGFAPKADDVKPLSGELTDTSVAFALGVMYVIEGSSLGGRVILKNINGALGHNEDCGARYFAGYGGQTGSHWKSFLGQLIQYENNTKSEDEIIAGANYAFDAISRHFTKTSHQ